MMKFLSALCFVLFFVAGCMKRPLSGTDSLPVINASAKTAYFSISGDPKRSWNISPKIERDTLLVNCYQSTETVVFKTDKDSIIVPIQAGQTKNFYVRLKDSANAFTVIHGISPYQKLTFGKDAKT